MPFLLSPPNEFGKQAKSDLPFLNNLTYGTCNPSPDAYICGKTMKKLLASLKTSCAHERSNMVAFVDDMYTGLALYDISHPAGCISDGGEPGFYCYIQAIASPNFNDQYMYQTLGGLTIPQIANYSCGRCLKYLVGLFDAAPMLVSEQSALATFRNAYSPARENVIAACGDDFLNTS